MRGGIIFLKLLFTVQFNFKHCMFFQDIHYLEPYIEEVIKERKEREEWNKIY